MSVRQVHYTFNCGTGAAILATQETYNDGAWHSATFNRTEATGSLYIDGVLAATGVAPGATSTIEVTPPLYLGGIPANYTVKAKESLKVNVRIFRIVTTCLVFD